MSDTLLTNGKLLRAALALSAEDRKALRDILTKSLVVPPKPPKPTKGAQRVRKVGWREAKIVEKLRSQPETIAQLAKETDISCGTVRDILKRLEVLGDVTSAAGVWRMK